MTDTIYISTKDGDIKHRIAVTPVETGVELRLEILAAGVKESDWHPTPRMVRVPWDQIQELTACLNYLDSENAQMAEKM